MELLIFAVVGIGLYFFSDWLLKRLEAWRGRPFGERSIVFFAIFLSSLLLAFALIPRVLGE
jgi:surface polysaccharide O-acyltransferase-like enzyme